MKQFRLTSRASGALDAIGAYSREEFGRSRGDRYVADLLSRCRKLGQRTALHQSCRTHFAEDLRDDLRFTRSGSHFVIFIETPAEIVIVDFIHQSADIGGRLGEPEP